ERHCADGRSGLANTLSAHELEHLLLNDARCGKGVVEVHANLELRENSISAADVVVMVVTRNEQLESGHAEVLQLLGDVVGRPGVDQGNVLSIANKNSVTLADVEEANFELGCVNG